MQKPPCSHSEISSVPLPPIALRVASSDDDDELMEDDDNDQWGDWALDEAGDFDYGGDDY